MNTVQTEVYNEEHDSKYERTPPPNFLFKTTKNCIISPCVDYRKSENE